MGRNGTEQGKTEGWIGVIDGKAISGNGEVITEWAGQHEQGSAAVRQWCKVRNESKAR